MSQQYTLAERFKSLQGEGLYTGVPMAFIRFTGCSVGKKICHHCDTDFDKEYPWLGGGQYTTKELLDWVFPYEHICLTGGEPLDQDLTPFLEELGAQVHIETSGTVLAQIPKHVWLTVSPKPGYKQEMIDRADEIKIIVPGLGSGPGWPELTHARYWALHKPVFLQPRNKKLDVDRDSLAAVQQIIDEYPQFRLSVQLHKILRVR